MLLPWGISLEAQRAKIEAYARRPGVQKILKMAKAREIDAVIIVKLDRMFRNTENALTTARDLEKRGVALHSIGESLDTNSAMGKFFFRFIR